MDSIALAAAGPPAKVSLRRLHGARLVGEYDAQERAMDFQMPVVVDEARFAKPVHEMAYARAGGTDHLSERLLADLCNKGLRSAFLRNWPAGAAAGQAVSRLN